MSSLLRAAASALVAAGLVACGGGSEQQRLVANPSDSVSPPVSALTSIAAASAVTASTTSIPGTTVRSIESTVTIPPATVFPNGALERTWGYVQITDIDQRLHSATVELFCAMDSRPSETPADVGTYTVDLARATFLYFTNHSDPARGHVQDVSLKDWIALIGEQSIWRLQPGVRGVEFVDVYTPYSGECADEVTARWTPTR